LEGSPRLPVSGPRRAHAFPCTRCGQWKIARLVAEVDGDPARRLCNACYGQALAADPSGNTVPT